jgi:hypothetical protein
VAFAHPDVADDEELGVASVGDLHDAGGGFSLTGSASTGTPAAPALARARSSASMDRRLLGPSVNAEMNRTRPFDDVASWSATFSAIVAVSDPSVPTAIVPYMLMRPPCQNGLMTIRYAMNRIDARPTTTTIMGRFERSISSSCAGATAELLDSSMVMTSRIFL